MHCKNGQECDCPEHEAAMVYRVPDELSPHEKRQGLLLLGFALCTAVLLVIVAVLSWAGRFEGMP